MLRLALLVVLFVALFDARAYAQTGSDAEAHALFSAGEAAYSEGRYAAALNYFRQAYEMSGRALLLYNIGSSAEHLRRDEEALDAFERYLAETPEDAPDRVAVAARIEILRDEVAQGAVEPSASVDDDGAAEPSPPPPSSSDPAPWVLVGVGGAIALAGPILLALGYTRAATFQAATPGTPWTAVAGAHDEAPIFEGVGFAALGVGVAVAIAGVIWAIVGSGSPTQVSAWLDGRDGGLLLRGSF